MIRLPAVMLFLMTLLLSFAGIAADKTDTSGGEREGAGETIHVTAERLVAESEARWAEFIGNVKVVQGNDVITADRLKIFYQSVSEKGKDGNPVGESIKEIIATGNVKIHFDNKLAVTQRAVYTTADRVLVLSGDQSRITSDRDSISGEKITLYRADGRIVVEGGSKKPVEAVLFSGEKGIK